jgi:hypothetical protein
VKRRPGKSPQQDALPGKTQGRDASTVLLLPMEIQVGDRFTDHGFEWEVLTQPTAMRGAKTLRARIRRPGLPETEREMTWSAHERVAVRRGPRSAP